MSTHVPRFDATDARPAVTGEPASLPLGTGEMVSTMVGVAIVALGHDLNRRALI